MIFVLKWHLRSIFVVICYVASRINTSLCLLYSGKYSLINFHKQGQGFRRQSDLSLFFYMIPAVHSQRAKSNLIVNDIELEIEQEMSSDVSQ